MAQSLAISMVSRGAQASGQPQPQVTDCRARILAKVPLGLGRAQWWAKQQGFPGFWKCEAYPSEPFPLPGRQFVCDPWARKSLFLTCCESVTRNTH